VTSFRAIRIFEGSKKRGSQVNEVSMTLKDAAGAILATGLTLAAVPSLRAATYQAESATLAGGAVVATDHAGYTGTGFVAGYVDANKGNAATTFSVSAASAGSYALTLAFSNASASVRTLSLYVNGTRVRQVGLVTTASWDAWTTVTETATLNAGTNSVAYRFDAADTGNVNLDKIDVTATATYQAESAVLSGGAVVATDHVGYTGTGFVGGYVDANKGNAATTISVSASASGSYSAVLRYANATGATQTLSLYLNGGLLRHVSLVPTSSWDFWATETEAITLNSGTNTVAYRFGTTDTGNVNLDKVDVVGLSAAAPTATATASATARATATARPTATLSGSTPTATTRATATATATRTSTPTATRTPTATATATTGATPTSSTLQAESAALSGGAVVATDHTGYTGTGFVGGYVDGNKGNAATTFSVGASTAGSYTVTLRYSNASGVAQTLSLYVDGTRLVQISLAATTNWDTWAAETETVTLSSGTHSVQYKFDTTDTGNVNLDKIDVAYVPPTPTPTVGPTPVPGSYGATVPFTTYEAEDSTRVTTNGTVLAPNRTWGQLASEASARRAVQLTASGQYVQFNLAAAAQGMVVRYSIPDTADGSAYNAGLSLYVGGVRKTDLTLTNKYSWLYGTWTTEGGDIHWSNNPNASPRNPHRFFAEVAVKLDASYASGTQIKLMRETSNTNFSSTASVTIDLVETEAIPAAIAMPSNFVALTSYGATANDAGDDTAALSSAMAAVTGSGGSIKGVWIPEGTFEFNNGTTGAGYDGTGTRIYLDSGVSVRGAGMWRSVLHGKFAGLFARAGNVTISDLKISSDDVIRDDHFGVSGIEGVLTNSTVSSVWLEHGKVGIWTTNQTNNATVTGCRLRDIWADGINLARGTSNSTVTQTHVRNSGDDGLAMWSETYLDVNNAFTWNTVITPTLANGIAIYGGQNHRVQNNLIADIIDNGAGISFGTNFNPPSMTGTFNISNNSLVRTGSWHHDYAYGIGAIWGYWLGSAGKISSPTLTIASNVIQDSTYSGILIEEPSTGASVTYSSNTITNVGTYGVLIKSTAAGTATFNNNTVNGTVPSGKFLNQSTALTVSGSGNNW
jgi:Carbohydrate binding module (family 6)/Right handed beta helix region